MTVELHMLPVQAGDATLLIENTERDSHAILIDGGWADEEIVDYLLRFQVKHLDLVILSHPSVYPGYIWQGQDVNRCGNRW